MCALVRPIHASYTLSVLSHSQYQCIACSDSGGGGESGSPSGTILIPE